MRGHITNDAGLLIHLPGGRDWIRLYQDGRYSHRIYPDDIAAMSYGICETSE